MQMLMSMSVGGQLQAEESPDTWLGIGENGEVAGFVVRTGLVFS